MLSEVYAIVSEGEDLLSLEQGVHRIINRTTRELLEKVPRERERNWSSPATRRCYAWVGKRTGLRGFRLFLSYYAVKLPS